VPGGREGNRRSGVTLVMHHGLYCLSTYGLNGLRKGDEHPEIHCCKEYGTRYLYLYTRQPSEDIGVETPWPTTLMPNTRGTKLQVGTVKLY